MYAPPLAGNAERVRLITSPRLNSKSLNPPPLCALKEKMTKKHLLGGLIYVASGLLLHWLILTKKGRITVL